MVFKLRIVCANAAFVPDPGPELVRMLRQAADLVQTGALDRGYGALRLIDTNGNTCGKCELTSR